MPTSAFECFGGPVGSARSVKVGQDVNDSFLQRPTQRDDLIECLRGAAADEIDERNHLLASLTAVAVVGSDNPL